MQNLNYGNSIFVLFVTEASKMSVVKQERHTKMSLGYDKSRSMLETGLLSDCEFEVKFLDEEPEVCHI